MVSQSQQIAANYRAARNRLWQTKPVVVRREQLEPPAPPAPPPVVTALAKPPMPVREVKKPTLALVPSVPKYAVRTNGLPLANPQAIAVIEKILEHHKVTWREVASPTRTRHITHARQEVYYYLRTRGLSYPQIARICGRSDHQTIIHGVRVHAERNSLVPADQAAQAGYKSDDNVVCDTQS